MEAKYKVLRDNIHHNLWNGVFWAIGFNLVTPFIGVLAARLNATNSEYALLSSVPALLTILVTLPAALILGRFRKQKRIVAGLILLCRFFYFLLIFVPLLPVSKVMALIWLVGLYNATNTIIAVAYQSIMGEIIPLSYRNKVFAQRNMWTGVCGMIVALVAGWGIDRLGYPLGYQLAFTVGFIAALAETWYFTRLKIPSEDIDPAAPTEAASAVIAPTAQPSGSRRPWIGRFQMNYGLPYYLFCGSAVIYLFAWQAAWPIFTKIKVDTLQATNMMISIDAIAGSVGSLIAFRPWAALADRRGNGFTVFGSAFSLALSPFLWIYAPNMIWICFYDFLGGFSTAGLTQAIFNRLLEIVPEQGRQRAIAIYTTLSQVSAVFAPIAGMALYASVSYATCMSILGIGRVFGAVCFLIILVPAVTGWFAHRQRQKGLPR
ncbi:hypothetical protein PAESOLCIP111_04318 [Paenibacillus solanacearum]|uniref:MFS transporter n=1 Tax=Paenibacillus solanacearum TaxID=2048548 RepID=A0A916K4G8_9BACL|nr:MFS transporter [Paenibacillus solanacearum]CAG7642266.1 hypothetical protein PAESOLCIP111_04318 [Paenibacillus solanacearum]